MPEPTDGIPRNPTELMAEYRLRMLTSTPAQFGIAPSVEHRVVYGVVMDWPLNEEVVATIVAFSDGNASLYTTSSFGIVGGFAHESVQQAAKSLVTNAEAFYDSGLPVEEFSYPRPDRVLFYILGFGGVRMVAGDLDAILSGADPLSELFALAQGVLTALRLITETGE
jgi:hypothetical protein